ncbi:MAG: histidine phosphatase family protein [Leptospiraceae bacterium]|nr:histidine phosphatase family protein [Leptospiraceae bacterium]
MRHGRPTLRYSHTPWKWLRAGELNALLDAYDEAGLHPTWNREQLTGKIQARPIASDLPRALETAALFSDWPIDQIEISPLLREVPLARFRWTGLRLPTLILLTLTRLGWLTGWMRSAERRPATRLRVKAAADLIEARCREHTHLAVYSHGFFLWLLGRELHRRGWHSAGIGPYRYLQAIEFTRA